MKSTFFKALLFIGVLFSLQEANAQDTTQVVWNLNNLNDISGVVPVVDGSPELIDINNEKAILFDGTDDRIVMPENPIIGWDEFTIEVIFRVDKGGVAEQKFFHLQANPDIRILFELEFVNDSMWYMENYIQASGDANIHLENPDILYAAGKWCHATVTYKDGEFKQYINYQLDNTNQMNWISPEDGSISIGARMNEVNYMKGAVRQVRFSNTALKPEQFLEYGNTLEEHETFILDNTNLINGYDLEVFGDPQVIDTDLGKAMEFDGSEDGIYILTNPLKNTQKFTIETIIKPYDAYPSNTEPRYLHIENPTDENRRITMELRLNDNHEWYFDGFIKSPDNNLTLIDETKTHPIDNWEHLAITYENGTFKTYTNYKSELEGEVTYLPISENGKMSLGMRMNQRHYFNGLIHKVRVTQAVLEPEQFMAINNGNATSAEAPITTRKSGRQNNIDIQVWPNPVYNHANIKISSQSHEPIVVNLYSSSGRKIRELYSGRIAGGSLSIPFNSADLNSDIYIISARHASGKVYTERVVVF